MEILTGVWPPCFYIRLSANACKLICQLHYICCQLPSIHKTSHLGKRGSYLLIGKATFLFYVYLCFAAVGRGGSLTSSSSFLGLPIKSHFLQVYILQCSHVEILDKSPVFISSVYQRWWLYFLLKNPVRAPVGKKEQEQDRFLKNNFVCYVGDIFIIFTVRLIIVGV